MIFDLDLDEIAFKQARTDQNFTDLIAVSMYDGISDGLTNDGFDIVEFFQCRIKLSDKCGDRHARKRFIHRAAVEAHGHSI